MEKVIVRVENMCQSYGKKKVIDDISIDVYEGEFLTILGPSGCGKTTILRAISGLDFIQSGKIMIDDVDVTYLDPTKREVNTIFQNYALFTTMSVEKNINFGLRMKHVGKEEIKKRTEEMLDLVKMGEFRNRKPRELSGGQQQRVAIARALINKPKVLLLDEPLSALDQKLRKQMQLELKNLQKKMGITFIYVTHSQDEALTMSDRIVILNEGKIQQIDTPHHIYSHPKTRFVADFIGESNIFDGVVESILDEQAIVRVTEDIIFTLPSRGYKVGDNVSIIIRPENFTLEEEKNDKNLPLKIKNHIFDGAATQVIGTLSNRKEIKVELRKGSEDFKNRETVYLNYQTEDLIVLKGDSHEKV